MRNHGKDQKMSGREAGSFRKEKLLLAVMAVIAAALVICMVMLVKDFITRQQADSEMARLKTTYVIDDRPDSGQDTGGSVEPAEKELFMEEYQVPERTVDFDAMSTKENKDIYAWITIPGTPIDYPVLQNQDEADYYLDHNIDGSSGYPGCIYTELYNSQDWEDPNTVLYGHNMKNGSMFGSLKKYSEPDFFRENKYIYVYSPDKIRVYEIFAAYENSDEHLVVDNSLHEEDAFQKYIDEIFQKEGPDCNLDRSISIDSQDRLITLSTCIKNKDDKRYLVQARLVAEM